MLLLLTLLTAWADEPARSPLYRAVTELDLSDIGVGELSRPAFFCCLCTPRSQSPLEQHVFRQDFNPEIASSVWLITQGWSPQLLDE
ncbi:MAG: hypothetical protein AAFV53_40000 [Myxococcota bacterium]